MQARLRIEPGQQQRELSMSAELPERETSEEGDEIALAADRVGLYRFDAEKEVGRLVVRFDRERK
jgi:hypothetical protein